MAINALLSVQYNGGSLSDIMLYYSVDPVLLPSGNITLSNAMETFCLCSPYSHLNVLTIFPRLGDAQKV